MPEAVEIGELQRRPHAAGESVEQPRRQRDAPRDETAYAQPVGAVRRRAAGKKTAGHEW